MAIYTLHTGMCEVYLYNWLNWVRYITVACLPLTVFPTLVVMCRFSLALKQLNAFFIAQLISVPASTQVILAGVQVGATSYLPLVRTHQGK